LKAYSGCHISILCVDIQWDAVKGCNLYTYNTFYTLFRLSECMYIHIYLQQDINLH
jgi:hypothetical protein